MRNALLTLVYGLVVGLRALWMSFDYVRALAAMLERREQMYRDRPSLAWAYNVTVLLAVVTFCVSMAW